MTVVYPKAGAPSVIKSRWPPLGGTGQLPAQILGAGHAEMKPGGGMASRAGRRCRRFPLAAAYLLSQPKRHA